MPKSKPAVPNTEGDGGWVEKIISRNVDEKLTRHESQIQTQEDEESFDSPLAAVAYVCKTNYVGSQDLVSAAWVIFIPDGPNLRSSGWLILELFMLQTSRIHMQSRN